MNNLTLNVILENQMYNVLHRTYMHDFATATVYFDHLIKRYKAVKISKMGNYIQEPFLP